MISTSIAFAADLLQKGNLVAIPTETVYGLAGDATRKDVVEKIFTAKNRPRSSPLILHTDRLERAQDFVRDIPAPLCVLARHFSPGAITFLLPRNTRTLPLLSANAPYIAVRIPAHEMTLSLLRTLPFPLAAPSANKFSKLSPTTAQAARANFTHDELPLVLDGGACIIGVESTIVSFDEIAHKIIIHRYGGITPEMLRSVLDPKIHIESAYHNMDHKTRNHIPHAGQHALHYAPQTPLYYSDKPRAILQKLLAQKHPPTRVAYIGFSALENTSNTCTIIEKIFTPDSAGLSEAAHDLYALLALWDTQNIDAIIAQMPPFTDLGLALHDRLSRASAGTKL